MARIYATKEQLEEYLSPDPAPSDAGRLLRSASRDVDEMLLTAVYPVDAAGLPTDPDDEEAIREATCLQAMHRDKHGDEIDMAGSGESVRLGPLGFGGAFSSGPNPTTPIPTWDPEAYRVLRLAGLIPGALTDG